MVNGTTYAQDKMFLKRMVIQKWDKTLKALGVIVLQLLSKYGFHSITGVQLHPKPSNLIE